MKLYLISARNGEFVGFTNRADAVWTAEGGRSYASPYGGVPTLGDSFRDIAGGGSRRPTFPLIEVELTDEQVKAARIKLPKATACT